jgi:hypothetical protein
VKSFLRYVALLMTTAAIVVAPLCAEAVEDHAYAGEGGFRTTFAVLGGAYELYIDAHFPSGITQTRGSCAFAGTLQRVDGAAAPIAFGGPARVQGALHYRFDRNVQLPAGRYALYVTESTDCPWKFILESKGPAAAAGLSPLQMFSVTPNGQTRTDTTAIGEQVMFYAEYSPGPNAGAPVSGKLQLIRNGAVIDTYPLKLHVQQDTNQPYLSIGITWDPPDVKYVGKNTMRAIVTIGGKTYTSSMDFTLNR